MKNLIKKIAVGFMALVLVLGLAACGGKEKIEYSGEYEAVSFIIDGEDFLELFDMFGAKITLTMNGDSGKLSMDEDSIEVKLLPGGKCTMDGDSGTWSEKDGVISLVVESSEGKVECSFK